MIKCKVCIMPDTRPDSAFVDGICPACHNINKKDLINWSDRLNDLQVLLSEHRNPHGYDCIVPSSGGKDSTYQVITLKELGCNPLVVTASTCMLTKVGRKNIDNLKRYADTIEVSPNIKIRKELNKIGLETVGDISIPEHWAIFSTPFRVAKQLGINLIFYGENPQMEYSGPTDTEKSLKLTKRWRSEFGGFLGLRPEDLLEMDTATAIKQSDLYFYTLPENIDHIEAHFLGQYIKWDSYRNARISVENGMQYTTPSCANYWNFENLDNAHTGLHDYFMFLKYGYTRACAQLSISVRHDSITRRQAIEYEEEINNNPFPYKYMGVNYIRILEDINITEAEFEAIVFKFMNDQIFDTKRSSALHPVFN